MSSPSSAGQEHQSLQSNALSLANGIALAAAAMAPVLCVVLNAPAAAPAAGGALPLAFLLAFLICLLVGNTVICFARRLPPSAGSFFTWNSHALGRTGGFFTGWLFGLGYAILAPGLFTALGDFSHEHALAAFGIDVPWWLFSLAGLAGVLGLSLTSIRASARVELALLLVEVSVCLILAVAALVRARPGSALAGFLPTASPDGFAGIGQGVVFGILSFVGFEAAATLAEETRVPQRNIPLAVAATLILGGLFYVVFVAITADGVLNEANPLLAMARRHAPGLVQAVALCAIAGIFSCFLAIHNTTARILFSLGREQLLPGALGRVHPRWRSPHVAVCVQALFTLAVGLPLGFWFGPGPAGAYGFTGAVGSVAIILVWMLSSLALVCFFRFQQGTWWLYVAAPILALGGLAYPLWATVVLADQPGQGYPSLLVPVVVFGWLLAGIALYFYLRFRARRKAAVSPSPGEPPLMIRTMNQAELQLVLDWAAAEGWNPGLNDATCFHAADPNGFLLGELDGQPVGSIATVAYDGAFGVLGLYIVRPEFRGRGFGLALWNAGMAYLRERNVGLDGVLEQQENYTRSGFRPVYRHVRFEGIGGGEAPPGVVDLADVPFEELLAYDREMFPAVRPHFLSCWIRQPGATALGYRRNGRLAGYGVLRPCRSGFKVGPLFADDERIAEDLFRALIAGVPGAAIFLDAPEANPAASALARRHQMREVFSTARMYTGAAPCLPLQRIFAATSLELG